MCLGLVMYFSIKTRSSLKALSDYLLQDSKASEKSYFFVTILIPFPPPPETALIRTGYPILSASSASNFSSWFYWWYPGTTGTFALVIIFFDSLLLPMLTIAEAGGPIKVTPFELHSSANPAFSDRNPNPGCKASHWDSRAICRILSELRYDWTKYECLNTGRVRTNSIGSVGHFNELGISINIAVNCNCLNAHPRVRRVGTFWQCGWSCRRSSPCWRWESSWQGSFAYLIKIKWQR